MVRNREEAAAVALAQTHNQVGTCQLTTRLWFDAPSVGDYDGDGHPDAEDGFKSEPKSAVHTDRNPPEGVPVSFLGGSHDYGHRALSLGNGQIRSTDMSTSTGRYAPGVVGTVSIAEIERSMGVKYVGWSETISGIPIPLPKPDPVNKSRGPRVDEAVKLLRAAKDDATQPSERRRSIRMALAAVRQIPFVN